MAETQSGHATVELWAGRPHIRAMDTLKRDKATIFALRSALENPYAFIEDLEEWAESKSNLATTNPVDQQLSLSLHVPLERPPAAIAPDPAAGYGANSQPSGNPYAYIADEDNDETTLPSSTTRVNGTTKKTFIAEAQRILRQYIPPILRGKLSAQFRAFISRNQDRSPIERFWILEELRRFDLSATVGLKPQFNRESLADIAEHKLLKIETAGLERSKR